MRFASALAVCLVVTATAQARKPRPPPAVQERLELGRRFYNTGDYARAIEEWKEAYLIDSDPSTLFAIGQAQRLSGDCEAALNTYRAVLREPLTDIQEEAVLESMAICEEQLDDQPAPSRPPTARPETARPGGAGVPGAGDAAVPAAAAPGGVEARRGARQGDGAATASSGTAATRAPRPAREAWYRDTLGDVLLGAGVCGLALGGAGFALERRAEDSARNAATLDDFRASRDAAGRYRAAAVVGLAGGGALVVGAVVRYIRRPARRSLDVTGAPTSGGGVLLVGGRF